MWLANVLIVLALACCALGDATKVLCRYNSTSLLREGKNICSFYLEQFFH